MGQGQNSARETAGGRRRGRGRAGSRAAEGGGASCTEWGLPREAGAASPSASQGRALWQCSQPGMTRPSGCLELLEWRPLSERKPGAHAARLLGKCVCPGQEVQSLAYQETGGSLTLGLCVFCSCLLNAVPAPA
jgi:hypothetical protein